MAIKEFVLSCPVSKKRGGLTAAEATGGVKRDGSEASREGEEFKNTVVGPESSTMGRDNPCGLKDSGVLANIVPWFVGDSDAPQRSLSLSSP